MTIAFARRITATVTLWLFSSTGVFFAQESSQAPHFQPATKTEIAASNSSTVLGDMGALQPVTTAQLTEIVEKAKIKNDKDAAKDIEHLELSESLSSPELARLTRELPGAISRSALIAVGDASVFLEPPQTNLADKAAPDAAEQQQIVSRASDYLKSIIPKLPNFYARRTTSVFKREWIAKDKEGSRKPGALHLEGNSQATVLYRQGKEVVDSEGVEQTGLITRGTFGPILSVVIPDNLRNPMQWRHWEKGTNGSIIAVFQFQVREKDSHYAVSFPMGVLTGATQTGYHGEIGIDPATGTILRVLLQSDPVSESHFIGYGNVMLEYASVMIGGKPYTCPVRGVSISTGSRLVGRHKTIAFTLLDDVAFNDYHVFRSEIQVLPR